MVTQGVVLPLIALVLVFAAGQVTGEYAVFIAMMAAVPMWSAIFAGIPFSALVGFVTFLSGLLLAFISGNELPDMVAPLVGLIVFTAIAIIASRFRTAELPHAAAPVELRKGVQFQLQTQADTDSMTGLLNRRGAIRVLGSRNASSDRVVAFMDCDLFKDVNERYGSDVGDEFLQAVAGRLRHALPPHDTVARWDGDEFLLAVSADGATAQTALERVMKSINSHPVRTTSGPVPASVSVGAAVWAPGQELEDVISRAGRALYAAKSGGRGRVVVDGDARASVPGSTESAGT